MKKALVILSLLFVSCGIWMIASGFGAGGPTPAGTGPAAAAVPAQTGNPVLLGTLLIAGGVVFLVVLSRRR